MDKQIVLCPECNGLSVIGTAVGGNPWRGRTYDCDTCHGTGEITMFCGKPEPPQEAME